MTTSEYNELITLAKKYLSPKRYKDFVELLKEDKPTPTKQTQSEGE